MIDFSYPSFLHLWMLLDLSSNNQWNSLKTIIQLTWPSTMMGRAHRSNCRQWLMESFVEHTKHVWTGKLTQTGKVVTGDNRTLRNKAGYSNNLSKSQYIRLDLDLWMGSGGRNRSVPVLAQIAGTMKIKEPEKPDKLVEIQMTVVFSDFLEAEPNPMLFNPPADLWWGREHWSGGRGTISTHPRQLVSKMTPPPRLLAPAVLDIYCPPLTFLGNGTPLRGWGAYLLVRS